MNRYPRVTAMVMNTPWAILPEKLAVILDVLRYHAEGGKLTTEEVRERVGAVTRPTEQAVRTGTGAIAVLPLYGIIAHRAGILTESSGGTSTERFAARFRELVADPGVGAIVLDVDSPGGTVDGVDELSTEIYRARGSKPIVAVANSLAASAAYWIASAADEVVVTPSGEVGSIGVLTAHEDQSALLEREGVKVTLLSAGKYKAEGSPYEPLGEEARAAIQARVDDYYAMFTLAVARNRKAPVAAVRDGYGEGRVVGAREALQFGMVNEIGTLEATIERVRRSMRRPPATIKAELDYRQRRVRAVSR
jgi:signal peptide peptidase SppA